MSLQRLRMDSNPIRTAVDSSDVRLTLRGLFMAMMIMAVLAGATGAILRKQRILQPLPVTALWLGIVTGIVAGTSLAVWRRRRLERLAGPLVARGQQTYVPWPRLMQMLDIPLSLLGFAYMSAITVAVSAAFASGFLGTTAWIPFVAGCVGWTLVAGGAAAETWRRSVRICTNGVVHADMLVRWPRVRSYYWHPRDENVLVLCLFLRRPAMAIRPEDRAAIETLLRDSTRNTGP